MKSRLLVQSMRNVITSSHHLPMHHRLICIGNTLFCGTGAYTLFQNSEVSALMYNAADGLEKNVLASVLVLSAAASLLIVSARDRKYLRLSTVSVLHVFHVALVLLLSLSILGISANMIVIFLHAVLSGLFLTLSARIVRRD